MPGLVEEEASFLSSPAESAWAIFFFQQSNRVFFRTLLQGICSAEASEACPDNDNSFHCSFKYARKPDSSRQALLSKKLKIHPFDAFYELCRMEFPEGPPMTLSAHALCSISVR